MQAKPCHVVERSVRSAPLPTLPVGRFRPRQGIVIARALDTTVLMDMATERYYSLDPVAARIWELLVEGTVPAAVVEQLCAHYDADENRVTADVAEQIKYLQCNGLLESTATGSTDAPQARALRDVAPPSREALRIAAERRSEGKGGLVGIGVPSVLQAGLMLALVKGLLKVRRLAGTLAWIRRKLEAIPANAAADLESVKAIEYAVAMAGAFYPGRAKCLEQSLTLYCLLRRRGVAAQYCQGVQPYPFEAHAWIEYMGLVINDVPEHVRHFARFPAQLP